MTTTKSPTPALAEPAATSDTELLNWLIFYSAQIVIHESAERVTIKWYSATDESTEGNTGPLDCSPREAICKAMEMEKSGNVTAKENIKLAEPAAPLEQKGDKWLQDHGYKCLGQPLRYEHNGHVGYKYPDEVLDEYAKSLLASAPSKGMDQDSINAAANEIVSRMCDSFPEIEETSSIDWKVPVANIIRKHAGAAPSSVPQPKLSNEEFSLMLDMRDAAIQYLPMPEKSESKVIPIGKVRGLLADFAGHMILEDRKARASSPSSATERAALKAIRDVACGEDQVSDDDTEALAWVYQRATTALGTKI